MPDAQPKLSAAEVLYAHRLDAQAAAMAVLPGGGALDATARGHYAAGWHAGNAAQRAGEAVDREAHGVYGTPGGRYFCSSTSFCGWQADGLSDDDRSMRRSFEEYHRIAAATGLDREDVAQKIGSTLVSLHSDEPLPEQAEALVERLTDLVLALAARGDVPAPAVDREALAQSEATTYAQTHAEALGQDAALIGALARGFQDGFLALAARSDAAPTVTAAQVERRARQKADSFVAQGHDGDVLYGPMVDTLRADLAALGIVVQP